MLLLVMKRFILNHTKHRYRSKEYQGGLQNSRETFRILQLVLTRKRIPTDNSQDRLPAVVSSASHTRRRHLSSLGPVN